MDQARQQDTILEEVDRHRRIPAHVLEGAAARDYLVGVTPGHGAGTRYHSIRPARRAFCCAVRWSEDHQIADSVREPKAQLVI